MTIAKNIVAALFVILLFLLGVFIVSKSIGQSSKYSAGKFLICGGSVGVKCIQADRYILQGECAYVVDNGDPANVTGEMVCGYFSVTKNPNYGK